MVKITLDNGLNVFFHEMLHTHSITVGLYIRAGSCYESKKINGITHFLEHLHFRRAGEMSQEELYYSMESIGSTLKGVTYGDFLQFSMKIVPEKLRECLYIFKNIVYADEWSDSELEKERQVVFNEIKEKGEYISIEDEVKKVVFSKSKLANKIIGLPENIADLTKKEVIDYKKKIFNKNNMVFCITGHVTEKDWYLIKSELETLKVPDGKEKEVILPPKVFHKRKPSVNLILTEDDQLDVNISFDITYDEKTGDLLKILNCILGEGTGSNLQNEIRENLGFTSDIFSYVDWYTEFAVLHVRFSVSKNQLIPCFYRIVQIINNTKTCIKKRDLDISLPFYTTNLIFNEDDTEEMNFQLAYNCFVLKKKYGSIFVDNSERMIEDLQEFAKKVFIIENVCVVIIGDIQKVSQRKIREIMKELL